MAINATTISGFLYDLDEYSVGGVRYASFSLLFEQRRKVTQGKKNRGRENDDNGRWQGEVGTIRVIAISPTAEELRTIKAAAGKRVLVAGKLRMTKLSPPVNVAGYPKSTSIDIVAAEVSVA